MIILVCDKCKKKSEEIGNQYVSSVPSPWHTISFNSGYGNSKYILCSDCKVKYVPKDADSRTTNQSIGDQLLQIIEDIVDERMEP